MVDTKQFLLELWNLCYQFRAARNAAGYAAGYAAVEAAGYAAWETSVDTAWEAAAAATGVTIEDMEWEEVALSAGWDAASSVSMAVASDVVKKMEAKVKPLVQIAYEASRLVFTERKKIRASIF